MVFRHSLTYGARTRTMNRDLRHRRSALFIAVTYALLASAWIVSTDVLMNVAMNGASHLVLLNVAKGLAFVAATSCALYFLVRAHLLRIRAVDEQLDRVERLRRLGEVVAGITHDFNNILMACRSFMEVLRRTTTDRRAVRAIQQIENALARGKSLTREILMFAEAQPPSVTHVPLTPFLTSFAEELRSTMKGIDVAQSVTPTTLRICGDPDQLHRLFMNLAVNACDAMNGHGTLTFAARPARTLPAHLAASRRAFVEIIVSDTGTGIEPVVLARMFEPQFTTKRTGTGWGLAIVQRIAQDHGGHVQATSRLGIGTTVTTLLPQCLHPDNGESGSLPTPGPA